MTNSDQPEKPKPPKGKRVMLKPETANDVQKEKKLTPKQERMIVAIMTSPTLTAAAAAVGIDRVTMHKWLKEDHFKEALHRERRRTLDQGVSYIIGLSEEAILSLRRNLGNPDIPGQPPIDRTGSTFPLPHTQVMAASKIIDFAHRGMESLLLFEGFEELRAKVKELENEIERRAASQNDVVTDASVTGLVGYEGDGEAFDAVLTGDPTQPGADTSARGEDAGSVADGLSESPNEAIEPIVLPPSGEDDSSSGEGTRPLFD